MKTSLKIFLLAVVLAAMPACSAQKRAERHIRKAVALCPEIVQTKAHAIDTVLTAPGFADCTVVPFPDVGETLYSATDHGTVVVGLGQNDNTLRVGFVAAPQKVHYQDTVQVHQIVCPDVQAAQRSGGFWKWFGCVLVGVVIGFVALIVIAIKVKIVE